MKRTVHCEDALKWLENTPLPPDASLVASRPDISEFQISLSEWKEWFQNTARLILSKTPDEGVAIFFQSDIKFEGQWVDKAFLVQKAAEETGHALLWHKIICRAPVGYATFGRPAYSHLLCFSKNLRLDPAHSTADVLPTVGDKTWERGMGSEVSKVVAKFLKERTNTQTVIHPFCGEGSVLAHVNALGLSAIGIEKSPKRAEKARKIQWENEQWTWNE